MPAHASLWKSGRRRRCRVLPKRSSASAATWFRSFTNHPKVGDIPAFNQALCGLYAAGLGRGIVAVPAEKAEASTPVAPSESNASALRSHPHPPLRPAAQGNGDRYAELGHLFADFLERGGRLPRERDHGPANAPVVITGAALGLPGTEHIFDDAQHRSHPATAISSSIPFPHASAKAMLDKHITRLVKSDNGGPHSKPSTMWPT